MLKVLLPESTFRLDSFFFVMNMKSARGKLLMNYLKLPSVYSIMEKQLICYLQRMAVQFFNHKLDIKKLHGAYR